MSIQHIANQSGATIRHTQNTLRAGQIIQGKILKLFPTNKAQIQLGSQIMIAQLEASLTTGENYHFQVLATGDVIRLKVIGEQLKSNLQDNVMNLIRQMGLRTTKETLALMKLLMNERIPFDKEQLQKAFRLAEGAKNKVQAQQALKEMIARKLPITDSIFQAFYTKNTSGLSEQLNTLLQALKQHSQPSPLQKNLVERLTIMTERPLSKSAFIKQLVTEGESNNPRLFNLLKVMGAIGSEVDFSSWKTQWKNFANNNDPNQLNQLSQRLPFQLNYEQSIRLLGQYNEVGDRAKEWIQQWSNRIGQSLQNKTPLETNEFNALKHRIEQTLLPLLSTNQEQQMTKLLHNNPVELRQLLSMVHVLENYQVEQFFSNPKEQFLAQLRQVLNFTGLSYENQLLNDQQPSSVLKAMLIQFVQQTDGIVHERSQQLLHVINGLQFQSVSETANFIQASIQLPGQKLGINGDLKLDFEGKKTENGEINPDYCRIIFYLDLTNLNETVIDMNIQKRTIALTIYNNLEGVSERANALKSILKQGLESLDYHLSTVTVKSLREGAKPMLDTPKPGIHLSLQGVDFRI